MKNIKSLTAVALLVAASVSTGVYANKVGRPGFQDKFNVTIGTGVAVATTYKGSDGSIFNMPSQGPTCSGNQCSFTITDNHTITSIGSVYYLIGDGTKLGPYCSITINDGALAPRAKLSASCANGAENTPLMKGDDNNYEFSVLFASKK